MNECTLVQCSLTYLLVISPLNQPLHTVTTIHGALLPALVVNES